MRTTLTLDPDLAPRIARLRKERGVSMARVVNDLVRAGLVAPPARARRYRLKTTWKGRSLVGSIDNIAEVLAVAEGDAHR